MNFVKPEVYVIANSYLNFKGFQDYLHSIDCLDWFDKRLCLEKYDDLDVLPEIAGRLCYRSFAPGLNPNVTKIRTDSKKYIENILKQGHGSVLEHESITFIFRNVSRVFTHELITHRPGCAKSQESLRYVRLDNLDFVDPTLFLDLKFGYIDKTVIEQYVESCENFQKELIEKYIKPGMNFSDKKKLTSWFRRFAPLGLATSILWTANLRALRHIIPTRTSLEAEIEIRKVFDIVAEKVKELSPLVFQDMERQENGTWIVEYRKV